MNASTPQPPPPDPILASWKISEVLQRHPDLLEPLAGLNPAFARLRNPLMRTVQARLVTVEQAAAIAGIAPDALVRDLNRLAGLTPPELEAATTPAPAPATGRPAWHGRSIVFQELDVRPMLDRGEEPFTIISAAARSVPVGQVLRVRVGFEPVPLYEALGKQGFEHAAKQQDGCWRVDFLRVREPGEAASTHTPGADPNDLWDLPANAATVTIDVSELVPPEPMVKILTALEALPAGERLLVHHVRRPLHLYDRLDDMGYRHATREPEPGRVEIAIEKPASGEVAR